MSSPWPVRKSVWVLSIAIAICALMVLPGASFLASGGLSDSHLNAATTAAPSSGLDQGILGKLVGNAPASAAAPTSTASTLSSSLFSGLSPTYATAPWVESLAHSGPATKPLTSLPSINILKGAYTSVAAAVAPGYVSAPAPLGLADFGLGENTYSYNTSHILGQVVFNTPPNATNPSATNLIMPNDGGQHEGYIGSPYTFGIQLNTIATDITIPGSNSNFFWTQNVVNWNNTGIHFVDDTFNATGGSILNNTIVSGCGTSEQGVLLILDAYGGVFQCVGATIPVSAASYPVTLQLYNNATTNAQHQSVVSYGYRIVESGTGAVYTGISDTIVFNNPTGAAPTTSPAFSIDGFSTTPGGFLRDAEIVVVGGIGGANAAFNSINGTINLEYSNASAGAWQNVPSAYNWGGDTGETSAGIASYWTPSHTLEINTGPALLYGLWNSERQVSVASGDIQIAGSIAPTYGFVFLGNLAPDVLGSNLSWFPTTSSGTFNTYLPPLGSPWTHHYYVQAWAAEHDELNGTPISGSTTSYTLTLASDPGVLDVPLYMFSNAQAAALADAVTGSATPPFVFSDLVLNMNFTFNHLNDYTFPVFNLFMAQGVTDSIQVNDIEQGTDSASGNYYFYDEASPTGILTPPASILPYDLEDYTAVINIFGGTNDQVTNETLEGVSFGAPYPQAGGTIVLWQDTNAFVYDTVSYEGSSGVWVGQSLNTVVSADASFEGATGVSDVGSTATTVWNLEVGDGAFGIYAYSSYDGAYSWINVSEGSIGVITGFDQGYYGLYNAPYYNLPGTFGLTVNELDATEGSLGANITLSTGTTLNNVTANDPEFLDSEALSLDADVNTAVNYLFVDYAYGFDAWNLTSTTIDNALLADGDALTNGYQSYLNRSTGTTIEDVSILGDTFGIWGTNDADTTLTSDYVAYTFGGVVLEYASGFSGTDLNSSTGAQFAYELDYGTDGTVTDVNAYDAYIGFNLYSTNDVSVSDVVAQDTGTGAYAAGVQIYGGTGDDVSGVTALADSVGVRLDGGATGNTVQGVTAAAGVDTIGVVAYYGAPGNTISQVLAADGSVGVQIDASSGLTVQDVTATGFESIGVWLLNAFAPNSVTTVTAEDEATGVLVQSSPGTTVQDVTAVGAIGVSVDPSANVAVSAVSASDGGIGVLFEDASWDTATGVSATNLSVGVVVADESSHIQVNNTDAEDNSIGVLVTQSGQVNINGVSATNTTLSDPWGAESFVGEPIAAVVTIEAYQVQISLVVTINYPAALYDEDSGWGDFGPGSIYVQDLLAVNGWYAVILNDTGYGFFSDITATGDYQGVWGNYIEENDIVGSNFIDDTSYGVSLWYSEENFVWDSNFVGDNGATSIYNAAHIQAYSGYSGNAVNYFDSPVAPYTGNYWSDWNSWNPGGYLNPYYVGDQNWDYSPLAVLSTLSSVWFYAENFPGGTTWSVTYAGTTQTSSTNWIVFGVQAGTYAYSVGAVPGYTVTPSSGSVVAGASDTAIYVAFSPTFNVTLTETGLPAGVSWSATFGGVTQTGTTSPGSSNLTFPASPGTYSYQISPVAGFTASPSSGSLTVVAANYHLIVTFGQVSYAVTITASGLSSGTTWSATVNGVTQSGAGTSLTWYLPNGTYSYTITAPSGYTLSGGSGTLTVNGSPASAAGGFSSTSAAAFVSTDTFNTWFAVAIVIAVIALVVALLAVMLRRRDAPPPAAAWTGPQSTTTTSTGSSTTTTGEPSSGASWNEQPTDASTPAR